MARKSNPFFDVITMDSLKFGLPVNILAFVLLIPVFGLMYANTIFFVIPGALLYLLFLILYKNDRYFFNKIGVWLMLNKTVIPNKFWKGITLRS